MTLPLILSGDMPGNKQKTPACSTATKQPVVTVKKLVAQFVVVSPI